MQERIYYPLTSPQLSIWYTEKMYPGTSIANVAGTLRIKDHYDFDRLEQAINLFIKNNDGMRLRITLDENGLPLQYISEYEYQPISFIDFSQNEDPVKAMFKWDAEQTQKSLTLLDSALYCFVIIKLSDIECGFYVNTHHIISDAWSMGLLGSEVVKYYCALKACDYSDASFSCMPSYTSYIQNDALYKVSNRYSKDKLFWEKQFETAPELTVLKSRKSNRIMTESKRKTFIAPKKFVEKLRSYCNENKTTPYPLFLSALSMYINRVTSKEDIVIGTPILNRLNPIDKSCIGMFISTVPLRINVKSETSFTALSHEMLELCSAVYRHQRYPYDLILRQVREKYGFQDNLYDMALSYQNSKFYKTSDIDYSTRWHFNGHQSNSLTIHINDRDDEGILIFDCDYHTELYSEKEIDSIYQYILTLLWHALDNPKQQVCRLEMLPECEKKKLLFDFNDTVAEYPKDKTIHQLFEEQVLQSPEKTALIFEDKYITYKELNEKSNSLAWLLREKGVGRDTKVGILIGRSIELIVGILAILKAGGAYVPLEIESPDNRIDFIIQDSLIDIVLTNDMTDKRILSCDTINVKSYLNHSTFAENPNNCSEPQDLAYIIYTSGTTGEPKGVMIEHVSVINFISAVNNIMDFSSHSKVLSSTTVCFDVFVFELFAPLLNGACVVLANELEQKIPLMTGDLISKYEINKILTTPSRMKLLLSEKSNVQKLNSVNEIMLAGEVFPLDLLELLKKYTKAKILNGYGPTETTVCVSFKELTNVKKITIGKPISNTKFYVLDKYLNLVPTGGTGELYIAGVGLAEGYINRSSLTTNCFIQSPFESSERIYKSGDLAKWLPNGEIELLGRIDSQIKINGHRIELEEIKSHILKIEGIKDAIVIDQTIQNNKRIICAYLITEKKAKIKKIREALSRILPEYMIPSYITTIPNIPVTANGKVARDKLPKPLINNKKINGNVMPKNNIEKEIYKIWQETLNVKALSIYDALYEIGGDSLDSITISSMISKKFGVDLPVTEIKEVNTIRKMAKFIQERNKKDVSTISNLSLLSSGGKTNLFFIHAGNGEIDNYISIGRLLKGEFTCWGIKTDFTGIYPLNVTIKDIASKYVNIIKTVQHKGPYNIAGWCIGGTIAFEMANILESNNETVNFLGLINSIAPKKWSDVAPFTPSSEVSFIKDYFNIGLDELIEDSQLSIEYVWDKFIAMLENNKELLDKIKNLIPGDISVTIPRFDIGNEDNTFYYVNCIRTLHTARALYFPNQKVKTDVYFFNAINDTIIKNKEDNYKKWDKYCTKALQQIDIRANHFTLFKDPAAESLADAINYIINSSEVVEAI